MVLRASILWIVLACLPAFPAGAVLGDGPENRPAPGPFHMWLAWHAAPFATIHPALSDSSQGPDMHFLTGGGIHAQYREHLLSLQYLASWNMFDCLFGCDLPEAKTNQLQALWGRAWVRRPGLLSLQGGPSLAYGMGRGRLLSSGCTAFLDCDSRYEEKPFFAPGLVLQASAMACAPAAGVGMTLNLDWNRGHGIYAFMLTVAFGAIRDEQP